jgi:DNA-binding NarL/FixJ family response regulator
MLVPEASGGRSEVLGSTLTVVTVAAGAAAMPGLAEHLASHRSIATARCAARAPEVVAMCRQLAPCILVVDSVFLESIELATFSTEVDLGNSVKALVTVEQDDAVRDHKMLKLGISGILRREASAELFGRALLAIADGELWAPRKVIAGLVRESIADRSPRQLTGREQEILQLIAGGYTNREIGEALFITRETVRWHVRSIYAKLGASDREAAIRYAVMTGKVTLPKPATSSLANTREQKAAS